MTIRLRGHHLLCLLTYQGRGYTRAFTVNYTRMARRLSAGEMIAVVEGPDDICTPLLCSAQAHCHHPQSALRDRQARAALEGCLNISLAPGTQIQLTAERVQHLRAAFASGEIRTACSSCCWREECTAIADAGFSGTLLKMAADHV